MKICATIVCMACALAAAAPAIGPAAAQDKPSLQELLGRAQSQSERKAVEDLIDKLSADVRYKVRRTAQASQYVRPRT